MDITIYDLIDATRKLESVKEAYYRAYTEILTLIANEMRFAPLKQ